MKTPQPILIALIAVFVLAGFGASPALAQTQVRNCDSAYTVEPGDTLSEIAVLCEVSYSDLLEANPDIDNPRLIYPGQIINIPGDENGDNEPAIPVTGGSLYIVKPGDSLTTIAGRFNVTTQALMNANPWLRQFERVYPGMRLTLPRGANLVPTLSVTPTIGDIDSVVTLAATGFNPDYAMVIGFGHMGGPYYEIGRAITDGNGAIVRDFNIPDWADVASGDYVFVVQGQSNPNNRATSNRFNLTDVEPGDPGIPTTGGPTVRTYTVKSGDTLFEVAQMFDTTLDALLDLNPSVEDAAVIYPGQVLQLPQGTRPAGPYVTVSAPQVGPGDELSVKAYNFPGNAHVDIRLAPRDGRYIQPYDARMNSRGNLTATIRVPESVENGEYRMIVITTERRTITRAESQLFVISDRAVRPAQ